MSTDRPASVHVYEIGPADRSGIPAGEWAIWIWDDGESDPVSELMWKPAGTGRFQPPATVTRVEEQP